MHIAAHRGEQGQEERARVEKEDGQTAGDGRARRCVRVRGLGDDHRSRAGHRVGAREAGNEKEEEGARAAGARSRSAARGGHRAAGSALRGAAGGGHRRGATSRFDGRLQPRFLSRNRVAINVTIRDQSSHFVVFAFIDGLNNTKGTRAHTHIEN